MKTLLDSKSELLERLARLTPASPRQFGVMTPNQAVCHLNDSYKLALGEREASKTGTVFHRTVLKYIALHVMNQWPAGAKTRPEMDQQAGGTPPRAFPADKAELAALIERFSALPANVRFSPHPIFGQLTHWEWMRWGYQHAHHHLRQFGV
jgi:hypothetical protein